MTDPRDARPPRLGLLVGAAARQWRRAVDQRLQPFSLTEATWLPLVYLARSPLPMRQKDLAAALSVEAPALVRVLGTLEASGLIAREDDPEDRRAREIRVTDAGHALVARVVHVSVDLEREVTAALAPEDVAAARRVLAAIAGRPGSDAARDRR